MPRSRSGPAPARSSYAAASRPRPASSSSQTGAPSSGGGWFGSSKPQQSAPPPARAAQAPPPAIPAVGAGSGIFSGLMGNVVTGAALGTGSAMAHRAVDSMMGPRSVQVSHEHQGAPPPAEAPSVPQPSGPSSGYDPCEARVKAFADCMSRSNGDMAACNYYFEAMQSCKMASSQARMM